MALLSHNASSFWPTITLYYSCHTATFSCLMGFRLPNGWNRPCWAQISLGSVGVLWPSGPPSDRPFHSHGRLSVFFSGWLLHNDSGWMFSSIMSQAEWRVLPHTEILKWLCFPKESSEDHHSKQAATTAFRTSSSHLFSHIVSLEIREQNSTPANHSWFTENKNTVLGLLLLVIHRVTWKVESHIQYSLVHS